MEQQEKKVVDVQSVQFPVLNKTMWITRCIYEDDSIAIGIADNKKSSISNVKSNYADVAIPEFMTEMGSINSEYKNFFVVEGGMKFIRDNYPPDLVDVFLPIVTVNPFNPSEVALMCKDNVTQDIFYINSKENSFRKSLENCINQLLVFYMEPIKEEAKEVSAKINSWIVQYLRKQKIVSFDSVVHFEQKPVDTVHTT